MLYSLLESNLKNLNMKVKLTLVYCAFSMGDSFVGRYKFHKEIIFPSMPYNGIKVVVTLLGKDSIIFTLKDVTFNENGTLSSKIFVEGQTGLRGFEKYKAEDAYCANSSGPEDFEKSGWLIEHFPFDN